MGWEFKAAEQAPSRHRPGPSSEPTLSNSRIARQDERIEVTIPGADNAAGGGDIPALVERLNPGHGPEVKKPRPRA